VRACPPLLVHALMCPPRPFRARIIYNITIIIFCILAAGWRRLTIDPSPASIKVMFAFATCQPDIINPDVWMCPLKGKKKLENLKGHVIGHYYFIIIIILLLLRINVSFFFYMAVIFLKQQVGRSHVGMYNYSSFISLSSRFIFIINCPFWTSTQIIKIHINPVVESFVVYWSSAKFATFIIFRSTRWSLLS